MNEEIKLWAFTPEDLREAITEETMGEPEAYVSEIEFMQRVQTKAQAQARANKRANIDNSKTEHEELMEKLILEKNDLVKRVEKLTAFMDRDDFEEIVETDLVRDLMSDQHDGMLIYLKALCFRIGMLS